MLSNVERIYSVTVGAIERFPQHNLEPKFKLIAWCGFEITCKNFKDVTAALYVSKDNTEYRLITTEVEYCSYSTTRVEHFNYYSLTEDSFNTMKDIISKAKQLPQNLDNVDALINTISLLKRDSLRKKIFLSYKVNFRRKGNYYG